MAGLAQQLLAAARMGDCPLVEALLAAGADPNAADSHGSTPLIAAACRHYPQCVKTLLAAGANPLAVTSNGCTALHLAAQSGNPHPGRQEDTIRLLLQAAPQAAFVKSGHWETPLEAALFCEGEIPTLEPAWCLLEEGPLLPAHNLLDLLLAKGRWAQPLYAAVAARQPLTAAEWARVPVPCTGLGAALPAVLQRSTAEAALLVRHLPPADRSRLQATALCLTRMHQHQQYNRQPHGPLPPLPTPVLWRMLALSVA